MDAINSMFLWYKRASICYAYLADVSYDQNPWEIRDKFRASRWFRRGWTLQELLAPKNLLFYSSEWKYLGNKNTFGKVVEEITGIPQHFLCGKRKLDSATIEERMLWAEGRETQRFPSITRLASGKSSASNGLLHLQLTLGSFEGLQTFTIKPESAPYSSDDTLGITKELQSIANAAAPALRISNENTSAQTDINGASSDNPRRRTIMAGDAQYDLVDAYNKIAQERLKQDLPFPSRSKLRLPAPKNYADPEGYRILRDRFLMFEDVLSFASQRTAAASQLEREANQIVLKVIMRDSHLVYDCAVPRMGYGGQLHPRVFGDHFLSNIQLIEMTELFKICHAMPKGANLHIHFNANLLPKVLIDIAKGMDRMYITSDRPLSGDGNAADAFDRCRIRFSIMGVETVAAQGGEKNIFDRSYIPRQPMRFRNFLTLFSWNHRFVCGPREPRSDMNVDTWLMKKLTFAEEEAHNFLQDQNR